MTFEAPWEIHRRRRYGEASQKKNQAENNRQRTIEDEEAPAYCLQNRITTCLSSCNHGSLPEETVGVAAAAGLVGGLFALPVGELLAGLLLPDAAGAAGGAIAGAVGAGPGFGFGGVGAGAAGTIAGLGAAVEAAAGLAAPGAGGATAEGVAAVVGVGAAVEADAGAAPVGDETSELTGLLDFTGLSGRLPSK